MADTKLSALSTATPVGTDELYLLDDPGGTPSDKKATAQSIADLAPQGDALLSDLASTSNGDGASLIGIEDSAGDFTAATVEGALAEAKAAIDLNTAKTSNATHTGDVTGATALTLSVPADVGTPASNDKVLLLDTSNSNAYRYADFSEFGGAGSGDAWGDVVDADVIPDGDGTRALGSTGTRFAQSYVDQSFVTEGFIVTEAADHPITPSAGVGQFWVSNAATQQPMFTDDAGTDRTILTDDGTALGAVAMASGDTIIIADSSDSDNLKETTQAQFITQMNMAVLGANTFTGTQDFNGQQVEGMLNKVVASVSGTLTTTAHSGNVLETSGNVTVPTTAGFNCVLIAGGAHTVTFNSNTSAAMAAGDLMTIIVEDATTVHAVLTASADKVTFS